MAERLTPEKIVTEAIALVDEEGPPGLTMRRLAARLDVRAPTLYWHVRSRGELVGLLLERVMGEVRLPPEEPGRDGRADVEAILRGLRDVLRAHPGAAQLLGEHATTGPNALRLFDRTLGAFRAAGLDVAEACMAWHSVNTALVAATVAVEAAQADLMEPGSPEAEAIRRAHLESGLPHLAEAADAYLASTHDERFEATLGALLDGILGPRRGGS